MKKWHNLTPEECIEIASLAIPEVSWKFHISNNPWEGFDLVSDEEKDGVYYKYVFQIGFHKTLQYFEDLVGYYACNEKVEEYLKNKGYENI